MRKIIILFKKASKKGGEDQNTQILFSLKQCLKSKDPIKDRWQRKNDEETGAWVNNTTKQWTALEGKKHLNLFRGFYRWIIQRQVSEQLGHSFLKINKLLLYTFEQTQSELRPLLLLPFFQLSQQDDKLTSHLLTSQPNLPAIPSWPKHEFGKGGAWLERCYRSHLWGRRGWSDLNTHTHTHCHQDPVPCSCLKRPSRMELK